MGILSMLLYFFGGVGAAFGLHSVNMDLMEAKPWMLSMKILLVSILFVEAGALLHWLRNRAQNRKSALPQTGLRGFSVVILMWLLPVLIAWVQFELYVESVRMFPFITILGAALLVMVLVARWLAKSPFNGSPAAWPVVMTLVMLVGMPLGIFTVGIQIKHFHTHLTDVHTVTGIKRGGVHEVTRHDLKASQPGFYAGEAPIVSDELLELIEAISNAELIDMDEEIAAGRVRRLEDGGYAQVNADGTLTPFESGFDLENFFEESDAKSKARFREETAERRAEWEQEQERLRNSGRFFNRR